MLTIFIILFPMLMAAIIALSRRQASILGKATGINLLLIAALVFFVTHRDGSESWLSFQREWIPSLGINFSFAIDGFSALMLLLIFGVGAMVFTYASEYLKNNEFVGRFIATLLMFLSAMVGIVVSENLILLFLFWELTSITSYLLIGFNSLEKSRNNALQALLVTGGGGVFLLLGFLMLGHVAGTFEFSEIVMSREMVLTHPLAPAIAACIILGAMTKSGQFPFHFWLPNAMSAPTPVSAFLHSATMVKAGIFLIAKFLPLYGGVAYWNWALVTFGTITMLYASISGLLRTDLKQMLAYTTLAVLGLLTMLLGTGTELAVKSAVIFLMGHALYKSTLFLCAGTIDHATHTREVHTIYGLRKLMPLTALTALLAALSKSGFPPFFGFLGKEYVYKTGLTMESLTPLIVGVAVLSNMLLMALALKVGLHPFFSKSKTPSHREAHDPSPWMAYGPLVMAFIGLLVGLFPQQIGYWVTGPAASAILMESVEIKLKLWHGFNIPLLLSVLTLLGGWTLYSLRHRIWAFSTSANPREPFEWVYQKSYDAIINSASWVTNTIQNGSLRTYNYWIILFFLGLSFYKLALLQQLPELEYITPVSLMDLVIVAMILLGMFISLISASRLVMLLSLGAVGLGIAWIFAYYSGPDLAITQILVETLIVILFVLAIQKMSKIRSFSKKSHRARDAIIASAAGMVVTLLVIKSQWIQFAPSISEQLREWSYPLGKGKNVVNVILVDFRALDTLGEIVVLGIAAIGVFLLLLKPQKERNGTR